MSFKAKRFLGVITMVLAVSILIVGTMVYDSVNLIVAEAAPASSVSSLANDKAEKEKQLKEAKDETAEIQREIADSRAQQQSYQKEIEQMDEEIALLTEQLVLIEDLEIAWQDDKLEAEKTITELEAKKESEIVAFESMLKMSYQYGNDTYFNLIFGSEDIGDFLSRMDMINYHLKASDNIVANLSATIAEQQNAKQVLEESVGKIAELGDEKGTVKETLEQRSKEAQERKAALQAEEQTLNAELDAKQYEMEQMEKELKDISDKLEAERREQEKNGTYVAPKYEGGVFHVPTENYWISSEFSSRISPITGKPENHNGIDFAAPGGTNIYAAADGTVIVSKYSNSWGNVIQIDHGNGIVTLYAHCSWRGVEPGETVTKGQRIARVGTTGWSTGNHLHFTVYKNGVAVNPKQYLPSNI